MDLSFTYEATEQPIAPPSPAGAATFTPEDIFYYAYAVFHSPTYRERYAEFLKIDFPRLPLTGDVALFRALAELGYLLVQIHLLQAPITHNLITTFPESGDNKVAARHPRYVAPRQDDAGQSVPGRVYINKTQYFSGVPPHIWEFQIGGYQVLHKWLKDRKKRRLSFDEIIHYQRVVVALAETSKLMARIDETIPAWPLT
jgi:predicted helicase